ncbi:MAG: sugar ABC transporter substrate-binding protein [Clostridium sp.]|nr:sugar ABC transporter substrate-binding protein [Clostridium sp.]
MSLKQRLTSVGIIAIAALITLGIAGSRGQITQEQEEAIFSSGKETIYLWYTDEALSSYLSAAAVTYNENHNVRVVPVLNSGLEYLESINQSSLESSAPDLYILSHDSLEKAYLAGLAVEVKPAGDLSLEDTYIETGLKAAAYKDKVIAYPFYFETSSFLYNKTYLADMALKGLEAEADAAEGELAQSLADEAAAVGTIGAVAEEIDTTGSEGTAGGAAAGAEDSGAGAAAESRFTQEQIEERMRELLPATIDDIREFADNYDAPEQVEGVFKWDVTDVFYNYFFVGDAIDMGGDAGWDTGKIDIYNLDAIHNMRAYQELSQFFSIDTNEITYEAVLDEFMAGKMVFTTATTDAVARLEQAKREGLFDYDYDIAPLPGIDENHKTRSLSMTSCVAINGYSKNKEAANDFAVFLTSEYNDILYARAGKVSAAKNVNYDYDALYKFEEEYEKSIPMPKMLETSNFWVKLEVLFSQVWNGADANEKLKALSEEMKTQVTGAASPEAYLEEPEEPVEEESEEEEAVD